MIVPRIAVVHASFDGVLGWYCGVGTVTRHFIKCWSAVRRHFADRLDLSCFVLSPSYQSGVLGHNEDVGPDHRSVAERDRGGNPCSLFLRLHD